VVALALAALLTVIGYSVNDSVVVFDRMPVAVALEGWRERRVPGGRRR
jgi:preprotein translocase subunit SecF